MLKLFSCAQVGIERATIVGHSLGGRVAMALALVHRPRLDRLVVVDMTPHRFVILGAGAERRSTFLTPAAQTADRPRFLDPFHRRRYGAP